MRQPGGSTCTINATMDADWKIFINGKRQAITSENSASGSTFGFTNTTMHAVGEAASLFIGKGRGGFDNSKTPKLTADTRFGGQLAEIAIWRSTTAFTDTEMYNVFRATKNEASGFLSQPERVVLRGFRRIQRKAIDC